MTVKVLNYIKLRVCRGCTYYILAPWTPDVKLVNPDSDWDQANIQIMFRWLSKLAKLSLTLCPNQ